MAKTGENSSVVAYDPRQLWATNVAPLVVAAREGAAHAARTASRERARVRQQPAWWRQRWVIITTGGLAVVGAVGGAYAMMASRRSHNSRHAAGGTEMGLGDQPQTDGSKSTVDSGRAKMTDLARNMVHKLRSGEPDRLPEAPRMAEPAGRLGEHPTDGGGSHGQP